MNRIVYFWLAIGIAVIIAFRIGLVIVYGDTRINADLVWPKWFMWATLALFFLLWLTEKLRLFYCNLGLICAFIFGLIYDYFFVLTGDGLLWHKIFKGITYSLIAYLFIGLAFRYVWNVIRTSRKLNLKRT